MKKILMFILAIMLLTGCSNNKENTNKTQKETENKVSDKQTNIKLDDNDKQEIKLILSKDKTLKDYFGDDANKIKGNIDLNKEGKYEVKYLNSKGQEITKIIIVEKQEVKQAKTQSVSKDKIETKKETTTDNKKSATKENESNDEVVVESNTSGLDTSNEIVQYAQSLVGKPGLCDDIAWLMLEHIYPNISSYKRVSISQSEAQIGDIINYDYNESLGYGHVATYLGNGLALHGNMRVGDKRQAIISSVNVGNLSAPRFYKVTDIKYEKTEEEKDKELEAYKNEQKESLEKQYEGSDIFNKENCQKWMNGDNSVVKDLTPEQKSELVNYCVFTS